MQTSIFSLACAALVAATPVAAETMVGSDHLTRLILAFDVNDEAVAARLPEGFEVVRPPKGPMAGADLIVVLIDKHLARTPEGKPETPAQSRSVVFASLAKTAGDEKPRTIATRIFSTDQEHDPYKVMQPAKVSHRLSLSDGDDDARRAEQSWTVAPASGGSFTVELEHSQGVPGWRDGESVIYSAADPDLYQIYRYTQVAEVVMSDGLGKPIDGAIDVMSDIPELAEMFDGTEKLVSVISVPVYLREIFQP